MIKNLLYKFFIKHYLKIFHHSNIIVIKKDGLYFGGQLISEQKLATFVTDADALKQNIYLKVLLNTIRVNAENQILYHGKSIEEVHNNRMVIYTVGQIEKFIDVPLQYKGLIDRYTSQEN